MIGFLSSGQAFSQEKVSDTVKTKSIDQIVITGSSNPKKRVEASIAITTLKGTEIQERAPQSTADLLQFVPGFVAETSGGEVGNNLFARGIPSAGAYEYVQIQEDGLPIFEDGALQFANIDNFHRIDLTVKNVEAVRGGTASVFASGAPGGIINFLSNTGQNKTKTTVKLTTSSYGLFRTDFNNGGALVKDKLFYNVGGFYRMDNGIRKPGFTANKGGQIKLNLTYKFDKGFARVFYKYLNDRNIFYQVTPFIKNGNKVKAYPGFNPNYGTFASAELANINVPQLGGGSFSANLKDGVHPISNVAGLEFKYEISDKVKVNNIFKFTDINQNYNAIFAPLWMSDILTQSQYSEKVKAPGDKGGFGYDELNLDATKYTYATSGEVLASDVKLKRADLWFINKKMQNIANNLSFDIDLNSIKLNLGYYSSHWKSKQYWNWNSFLVTASDKPRLVNLQDTSTGMNYTYNGISQITWLERESLLNGYVNALFANADIRISEKFNANVGLRYDMDKYNGYKDNAGDNGKWGSYNLGSLSNSTADDKVTSITANPYTSWNYKVNELSYTAALNYKISDKFATYVRQSHGFRAPIEEAFYNNASKINNVKPTKINQTEIGFNGQITDNIALFTSLFRMKLKDIFYGDIVAGGKSEALLADVNNYGIEFESIMKFNKFNLNVNATYQNPTYSKFDSNKDYIGNVARRIPKFFFVIRPDYNITKNLNIYTKWAYFDKKYNDEGNTFVLAGFHVFDAGASYRWKNIRFGIDGSNLFNSFGLTEGDGAWTGRKDGDVVFGRAILGRAVRASVTLDF